ncbi:MULTISPECIES: hypothetical protein [unclassified Lebetimonas]|uniref:hypothetical protein n=1 Tax=unclassified Lebetimonas TaxID=2648158 RepID=UPI00046456CD|nr:MULTISPECIES: hypothetical protein [unclassified Lebetimonas]
MGYNSSGKKPIEFAGKTGHSEFIDEESKKFLSHCYIPQQKFDLNNFSNLFNALDEKDSNIKYVIAIDGGLSSITAKKFPSSKLVAIKIGALFLDSKKDLKFKR